MGSLGKLSPTELTPLAPRCQHLSIKISIIVPGSAKDFYSPLSPGLLPLPPALQLSAQLLQPPGIQSVVLALFQTAVQSLLGVSLLLLVVVLVFIVCLTILGQLGM